MEHSDFYGDRKYCDHCETYVPYLLGMSHSYCTQCGQQVRIFSSEDRQSFDETMEARKRRRGGRRAKKSA